MSLVTFGFLTLLLGCNQSKKASNIKNKNVKVKIDFKLKTPGDTTKFETKYNDGRITAVRSSKYYNYLVKNNKPFGDNKLG